MYSPNQLSLLNLFILNPEQEYHLHEIGRILQKKPGIFQKALNALEKNGILKSRRRGNQRLVSLNKEHPLLEEITKIIQKTAGIEIILKEIMVREADIQDAFIFGSYARNKMHVDSDIDVVCVGKNEAEDRILAELINIGKRFQREINLKFYNLREYNAKKNARDPFLIEILSERHIVLKGNP